MTKNGRIKAVLGQRSIPGTRVLTQGEEGTAGGEHHSSPRMNRIGSIALGIIVLMVGVLLVVAFFYFDRHGQISNVIRGWGAIGVAVAIFLMALFCIIPVPSEFLMVMNMKVYGVWLGIFYTWIGAMIGALAVFFIARYVGSNLLRIFISEHRLAQVDNWVGRRGAFGLLLARFVPLPFIVVNYAAGVLSSVTVWQYVWTTSVGLMPYDVGAALVFLGVSHRFFVWAIVGGIAVVAIWLGGYLFNRHVNRASRWAH